jgi:hypothetical protein
MIISLPSLDGGAGVEGFPVRTKSTVKAPGKLSVLKGSQKTLKTCSFHCKRQFFI